MAIAAVAAVGAVASIAGGMMAADAASSASDAQIAASREATQTQLQMYYQSRADQMPWLQRGNDSGNLLQYYLGMGGYGGTGGSGALAGYDFGLGPAPTIQQFTTTTPGTAGSWSGGGPTYTDTSGAHSAPIWQPGTAGTSTVDQAGFQTALSAYNQKLEAARAQAMADPRFGSLLRQFTGANLANDPGYQFGLHQGEDTITDKRAALGSLLSGATLKELTQFGNDYAGTKFNEAFNRDMAGKQFTYNSLAGVSGTGMQTANQVGQQGIGVGNAVGQNLMGEGNARASSYVGGANAINAGISGASNQAMSGLFLRDYLNTRSGSGGLTAQQQALMP